MPTMNDSIATLGQRVIVYLTRSRDSERDEHYRSYAFGMASGMAEAIVLLVVTRETGEPAVTVEREYVEALLRWGDGQVDDGRLTLDTAGVRAVRRTIRASMDERERRRRL